MLFSEDLLDVSYKERANQKDDLELVIGQTAREFLTDNNTEGKLPQGEP